MSDIKHPNWGDIAKLEQRVLGAAKREVPSRELSERMARTLGVSLGAGASTALGTSSAEGSVGNAPVLEPPTDTAGTPDLGLGQGLATTPSATAWTTLVPWASGVVVVAGLTAAVVGLRSPETPAPANVLDVNHAIPFEPAPSDRAPIEPAKLDTTTDDSAPLTPESSSQATAEEAPRAERPNQAVAPPQSAPGLRDEIVLVDSARAAAQSGSAARALELSNEYGRRFPRGSFHPEVTALKIDALMKLGRKREARTLGERFIKERAGTPLAARVARTIGQWPANE